MNNDDKTPDDKIIRFPDLESRAALIEAKEHEQKREEKRLKKAAKQNAVPLINWDKIPLFTRCAIGVLLATHLFMTFALDDMGRMLAVYNFGFIPALYTGGLPWSWTGFIAPFSALIIHGDWMHIAMNALMLVISGVFFERRFGAISTLKMFILCGLAGNAVYLIFSPSAIVPVIGASGSINGLFAITFLLMIDSGLLGPDVKRRGPLPFIGIWLVLLIGTGLLSPNTSWQAHLGGFSAGLGLFYLWKIQKFKF